MRWPVFAVATYVILSLQAGLAPALQIETGWGSVRPVLPLLLAAAIGMRAPVQPALLGWLILGVLMDLTTVWPVQNTEGVEISRAMTFVGPHAVGYLAAGYVQLQLRPTFLPRNPLSSGALVLICGASAELVLVGIMSVRMWYDVPGTEWAPTQQLAIRICGALFAAVLATPLALPLNRLGAYIGQAGGPGRTHG